MSRKHSHYFKDVSNLHTIDVYRVLSLFAVADPCLQHAVKKLLVAGGRGGGKDISKDVQEAIDTLLRWQEMQLENSPLPQEITIEMVQELQNEAKCSMTEAQDALKLYRGDIRLAKAKLGARPWAGEHLGGIGSGGSDSRHAPVYAKIQEGDQYGQPHCPHSMKPCSIPDVCARQALCAKPQG